MMLKCIVQTMAVVELDYNLEWDAYYGYCVCNPGWFGNMCEFMEEDL